MHTHSCIVVGIVEKKEKYSPWKEAVGQGFLGQKDGKRHISGAKGETIANIWSTEPD